MEEKGNETIITDFHIELDVKNAEDTTRSSELPQTKEKSTTIVILMLIEYLKASEIPQVSLVTTTTSSIIATPTTTTTTTSTTLIATPKTTIPSLETINKPYEPNDVIPFGVHDSFKGDDVLGDSNNAFDNYVELDLASLFLDDGSYSDKETENLLMMRKD